MIRQGGSGGVDRSTVIQCPLCTFKTANSDEDDDEIINDHVSNHVFKFLTQAREQVYEVEK